MARSDVNIGGSSDGERNGRARWIAATSSARSEAVSAARRAAAAAPIAATEAEAYDPGRDETQGALPRDRSHVKAFYRTNGYETLKK